MARKYEIISRLAEETAKEIVKNEAVWKRYLTTAARIYKYPFQEQLLIYSKASGIYATFLMSSNELLSGTINIGQCLASIGITVFLMVLNVSLAVVFFNKRGI